jgi:4-amino-4-deoxy-L-arabinose transferase-like glycosyltransferase
MPSSTPVTQHNSRAATGEAGLGGSGAGLWLWAIVALGAVLRLVALGRKSFWLDEVISVVIARKPGAAFWNYLWHDYGNMALYNVLLRPWLRFGLDEASVRLLSVIPGIASIPLMYLLGNRLFGKETGTLAALFLSLNACAVVYSQEARGYSLLLLGVIVSTYLFVRLIEEPGYLIACAYGVVAGLTLYCHYFGMFVSFAHAISLMALPANRRPWKQLALAASLLALFSIPVLWMIHIQNPQYLAWVQRPSWLELYHVGVFFAAESGKGVGVPLLVLDLSLIALCLRTLKGLWRSREAGLECWRYVLVASWLFSPIAVTLLVSVVRPIFFHRFLMVCLPAWVLMTALGTVEIHSRKWKKVAIVVVCVLSLAGSILSYTREREDWRGVVRYLIARARPQDCVLYYYADGWVAGEGYRGWLLPDSTPHPLGIAVNPGNNDWEQQINGAPRVWLVLYRANLDDAVARSIDANLRNRYKVQQQIPFRAVTVIEYRADR